MIRHLRKTIAASLLFLAPSIGPTQACTCVDQTDMKSGQGRDGNALMASRMKRAEIVVRGTFVNMRAGKEVSIPQMSEPQVNSNIGSWTSISSTIVLGDFEIHEALKGNVSGTVQVFSGAGLGDCGAGGLFLRAVAAKSDLSVELRQLSKNPPRYTMDMCGYIENHLRSR